MTDNVDNYPGTTLSEDDFLQGNVLSIHDKLEGRYAWDTGIAISRYLEGLKKGIILGAYCSKCRKTVVPPRTVCEWCFRPILKIVPLQDTGTVITYSICYVTWDVRRIQDPEIPAVIEIDGASPMHGILHKLGEIETNQISIGMRVQAVWKPPKERVGAITDILYFTREKEE
jgi:uncharacterized OB-fold protein